MIPRILQAPHVSEVAQEFLDTLKEQGFTGDTASSYADRLTMATDNSIYQLLPQAVVFPRSGADVVLLARVAGEKKISEFDIHPARRRYWHKRPGP